MTFLGEHDATGLAKLVADGQVSAKELCEATIAAIETENPRLNAVVETCFEEALASLDDLADGPLHDGPLHGVPWLVKDLNTMVGGMAATSGSRALRNVVAEADSELVARHRRAGLVVLGKTNTPEFGMNICTSPTLFGPTSNPFDASRSAGGSSGGSAAAVAAGILPAAHATDSGGSIRIPASNCGLFGLKPTRNRVPLGNDASEGLAGLSTGHAVTHSVRDSALLLDLTHGPLFGSGGPLPPTGRFLAAIDAEPGVLRVGLLTAGLAGEQIHPACVAAADRAARLLEELGHRVEVVDAPVDGAALRSALEVMFSVNIALAATMLPDGSRINDLELSTQAAVAAAETHTSVDYVHAQFIGRMVTGQLNSFFGTYDLLLTPTLAHPARPLGYHDPNERDWPTYINRLLDDIPFTPLFNTSGGPAASLPLGFDDDGLPVGVQLGAAFGNEELVLSVSRQLELAAPWHARG